MPIGRRRRCGSPAAAPAPASAATGAASMPMPRRRKRCWNPRGFLSPVISLPAAPQPYHLSHVQPGRFLNPGDGTADLSAFRFCPLRLVPGAVPKPGSLGEAMAQRFERYKAEIVHPFFRDVFSRFDRQLVLVDVIGALNAGPESFHDMRRALRDVLPSFNRGSGSLLARLFQPRTEKVLFAATKADHVTANQFHNLRLLLRAMMADDLGNLPISAEETDFAALSAIKCTANRRVMYQGQQITVLEGIIRGRDAPEQLYPGEIPEHLPWKTTGGPSVSASTISGRPISKASRRWPRAAASPMCIWTAPCNS